MLVRDCLSDKCNQPCYGDWLLEDPEPEDKNIQIQMTALISMLTSQSLASNVVSLQGEALMTDVKLSGFLGSFIIVN